MEHNSAFWSMLDEIINNSEIVIDRPKGSRHPKYHDIIYKVDYGYLKGTTSMGGGIDVWKDTDTMQEIDAVICTVDLLKRDSEIKVLIGCTEAEKEKIYKSHNDYNIKKVIQTVYLY